MSAAATIIATATPTAPATGRPGPGQEDDRLDLDQRSGRHAQAEGHRLIPPAPAGGEEQQQDDPHLPEEDRVQAPAS